MVDGHTIMMEVAKAKATGNPTLVLISQDMFDKLKADEKKAKGSSYADVGGPSPGVHYGGLPVEVDPKLLPDYLILGV